ncbi:CcoQ/FixQ family Cbb3-type cytochrome c oxidase assembly chaperone [bacterium SCSIO 12741]|nr:CcoQ/FixQ family Cbb3-type cytochrome c oxidase assembly chaperone [bacterium SCSIO 12741]
MLKFIKHHMTGIEGIEIFPLISMSIFVLFFTGLLVWVMVANKEKIKEISDYPLND